MTKTVNILRIAIYYFLLLWMTFGYFIFPQSLMINSLAAVILGLGVEACWCFYKDKNLHRSSLLSFLKYSESKEKDVFFFVFFNSGLQISTGLLAFKFMRYVLFKLDLLNVKLQILNNELWISVISVLIINSSLSFLLHVIWHKIPFLWRLHQTHHSATEMTGITQFREHLLIDFITNFIKGTVFFFLGLRLEVLGGYLFFSNFHQALIHSKIDSNWKWLELILVTPRMHHIHHSTESQCFNKNFSTDFVIWDQLFGTYQNNVKDEKIKIGNLKKIC